MTVIQSSEGEKDAVLQVAKLMLASARTAPKSGGVDDILSAIVFGAEKDSLVAEMESLAQKRNSSGFKRDARNVQNSEAVVLIGVRGTKSFGLDCGACGYASCQNFDGADKKAGQDFKGATCLFKALDLGIALGSAVKTASLLNVDSRIMYRVGTAARKLGMLPEASTIMGVPLSIEGKNIYFDRSEQT